MPTSLMESMGSHGWIKVLVQCGIFGKADRLGMPRGEMGLIAHWPFPVLTCGRFVNMYTIDCGIKLQNLVARTLNCGDLIG